ncbi:MAG: class I adenylate-forming enzyme family protein [Acidimicrobiales bacterium]
MDVAVFPPEVIAEYTRNGYWDDESIAQRIAAHAAARPDAIAFLGDDDLALTWREYDEFSDGLAAALSQIGLHRGDPIGLLLPDGPTAHLLYVAAEKAGLVAIGVGPRAGLREIAHILGETATTTLVSLAEHRGADMHAFVDDIRSLDTPIEQHVVIDHRAASVMAWLDGVPLAIPDAREAKQMLVGRALGPNDLFFINSTSGTTGMPKCVMHTQNRWKYFHTKCRQFDPADVFMVVVPAPFGFGLWMGHFSPTMLGATTVLMRDFDVDATLEAIERHRVTVLAAVTTQVLMLLASPKLATTDLSSLRIVQSGGERVPFEPAAEFERRTGTKILQFYGSNEAGCVCGTTVDDTTAKRLGTAGKVFPEMHVRLFDDEGNDVTASGTGRSACKGPGITPGYFGNADANAKLFRNDGWMYLGDIVQIDEDDYLRVVGRTADFIIRGGQNISAPAVEEELLAHPRVAMAAVVAMPDPILGERVCAYVVTDDGRDLGVDELGQFLHSRGVSKSMWPERVVRVDELPRGSGAKIGKAELRADIERRLAAERAG